MDKTGLGRQGAFERIEFVVGMSAAGADEATAPLCELPVQRLAREMSSYDRHEEAACGWCGCREGLGFVELAAPTADGGRSGAVEAVGKGEESGVVERGRDEADAEGKAVGAETGGDGDGGEVEQVDEV